MPQSYRKGPWVQEEDDALLLLVRSQGPNNWVRISQHMHFRSPKQCRERYHQNLKPSLNHDPITPEEGVLIERMVKEMGKRWAEIARRLGHRSDNNVKNWWNGSMNRRRRMQMQQNERSSRARYSGPQESFESYSQPAALASLEVPQGQHIETPLISPSASESAPSLVADTASSTASPKAHSPCSEFHLPPLVDRRVLEERRPSLPVLFYAHDETPTLSALSAPLTTEIKSSSTPNGLSVRPELVGGEHSRFCRHQPSQSLPQISLPPLQSVMCEPSQSQPCYSPQPPSSPLRTPTIHTPSYLAYSPRSPQTASSPSRDSRMNMSNLLS